VVECVEPFVIQLGFDATYKLTVDELHLSSSDVCGIESVYLSQYDLDCDNVGKTLITVYAKDWSGNIGQCETELTILGNTPPIVLNDFKTIRKNTPDTIDVAANDYDHVYDLKTNIKEESITLSRKPVHGSVELLKAEDGKRNGVVRYTPDPDFVGKDVFQYRIWDDGIPCDSMDGTGFVFITVKDVEGENTPPIAVNDTFMVLCDPITKDVLTNDSYPDGEITANQVLVEEARHGGAFMLQDGWFTYIPDPGFSGIDSFSYQICYTDMPWMCDTATVYLVKDPDIDCDGPEEDPNCELFIPEGFSPNDDGVHDFFEIWCLEQYPDARLMIFNRNGNKLYDKEHYGNLKVWGSDADAWWYGTSEDKRNPAQMGNRLPSGNYVYVLKLGKGNFKTGTVMIAY